MQGRSKHGSAAGVVFPPAAELEAAGPSKRETEEAALKALLAALD
jgi:hypothetical protein